MTRGCDDERCRFFRFGRASVASSSQLRCHRSGHLYVGIHITGRPRGSRTEATEASECQGTKRTIHWRGLSALCQWLATPANWESLFHALPMWKPGYLFLRVMFYSECFPCNSQLSSSSCNIDHRPRNQWAEDLVKAA